MALSLEELQNKRSKRIKAPKESPRPEKLKSAKRQQTPRPDIQFPWNPPGEADIAHTVEVPAKTSGPARVAIMYIQELVKVNRRRRASGKGFCLLSPFNF